MANPGSPAVLRQLCTLIGAAIVAGAMFRPSAVLAQADSAVDLPVRNAAAPLIIRGPAFMPDTNPPRPRAVMLSDGYYSRLRVHRIASYAALPIMATEYVIGEKLITDERDGIRGSGALTGAHAVVATGLIGLFALNTVTGVMNLYEARHLSDGRARRTIHSILMLIADGGFAYTASLGGGASLPRSAGGVPGQSLPNADRHQHAAIFSISVATASVLMMWLWKH